MNKCLALIVAFVLIGCSDATVSEPKADPQYFTLLGTATITKSAPAVSGASASGLATFNVKVNAIGHDLTLVPAASANAFPVFSVRVNGVRTNLDLVNTYTFAIPNGVVQTASGFTVRQDSNVIIPISFYFEPRTKSGAPAPAGSYSVEIDSLRYSTDGGKTFSAMAVTSASGSWATPSITIP